MLPKIWIANNRDTISGAALSQLALSHGCRTTLDRLDLARDFLLTLCDVMETLTTNVFASVFLCLGCRPSFDRSVLARNPLLGLCDAGDRVGVKLAVVACGCLCTKLIRSVSP
jgi:hypothetical protein